MIIGNGMIASAFSQFKNNDKVIIFASGVSNSKEERTEEYRRELGMLSDLLIEQNKKLIYFSTCSIYDNDLSASHYIRHKKFIEKYISKNFKNYIIFRLPNVVGKTNNKNTFFNYFKNKILNQETIEIKKNATRYLIDLDDLSIYLSKIINGKTNRKIINVCFNNKLSVLEIAKIFSETLNKELQYKLINIGTNYTIDNSLFIKLIKKDRIVNYKNYTKEILKKYLNKK